MFKSIAAFASSGKTIVGQLVRHWLVTLVLLVLAGSANAATFTISTPTTGGTFTLSWSGARTFVELYELVNGSRQKIGNTYNTTGSLNITKAPGTYTYIFVDVYVYGATGMTQPVYQRAETQRSVVVSQQPIPPVTPSTITVTPNNFTESITVSWGGVLSTTRYELERNGVNVYSGASTSSSPSGSVVGTGYIFRVRACNEYGCSDWRTANTVTLQSTFTVPASSSSGQYSIGIVTPPSMTYTRIEERVGTSGTWNVIATLGGTQSVPVSRSNGTYYYRLQDCVQNGPSPNCTYRSQVKSTVVSLPQPTVSASFNPSTINEGGSATLNWNSSNATSCSASGIAGVSAASGSVSYTASNVMSANSTVSITVTCNGGGGSGASVAQLNVNWMNDVPTISAISSRSINEDSTTGAIAFTVGDEETAVASLNVTASSNNQALIPNGNLQLTNSGANRTITAIPVANQFGVAKITLRVTDANGAWAETSFNITVNSVDDAPVISAINNVSLNELAETNVSFTVTDIDSVISGVLVTSSSNTLVTPSLSGGGNNYSVKLNAGRFTSSGTSGQATITVRVPFGSTSVSRTFTATVNNLNPELWIEETGTVGVYDLKWDYGTQVVRIFENGSDITYTINSSGNAGPVGTKRITKTANGTFTYYVQDCFSVTQAGLVCQGAYSQKQITVAFAKPVVTVNFDKTSVNEANPGATNTTSVLTWSATNATSCSASGISGVSGTSGSVTYTAPANLIASQTHTVTVTCTGGGGSTPANAQINLVALNDLPGISAIASPIAMNEDVSSAAIGFTVSDEETPVANLVVSAVSNNHTLIPNSNLQLVNNGANRSITVIPAANQSGSAIITVKVTDANNAEASRQFTVNVSGVDDAPIISDISGITINEGATSQALAFSISDIDTASGFQVTATSNRESLIPNANITLSGSGNNRQISVKAGRISTANTTFETATITLSVAGGSIVPATKTFTVRVNNIPAKLTVPDLSSSGVYDVSWDYATHGVRLYENGVLIAGVLNGDPAPASGTKKITKTANGKFTYVLEDCSYIGSSSTVSLVCNQADTKAVQITLPPAAPVLTINEVNKMGTYGVSWTSIPEVTRYILRENGVVVPDNNAPLVRLRQYMLKPNGTYSYTVQACINTVCGSQSAAAVIVVNGSSTDPGSGGPGGGIDDGKYVPGLMPTGPMSHIPVGTTAGSFSVDPSGAATYNIPIMTAAGTAGVAPTISVGYNSQGSNGILGKNWGLNAMSEISRCRQTLVQDKKQLPITWSETDRFCLNGQRLVVVSGTYGAPGSEYKTEIDSYVVVKANGGVTGNPDYFSMTAKDGSYTVFGGLGQHNAEVNARDTLGNLQVNKTLTWNISKFRDSANNPIDYSYNNTAEYFQLKEILFAYGANTQLGNHGARVFFEYENRDDPMGGYLSGYYFRNTQRLKKIESYSGTDLLRRYNFKYDEQPADLISGISSRLTSVEECVESGCLPKTTFSWATQKASAGPKGGSLTQVDKTIYTYEYMDFNGNGKQDLVWMEKGASTSVNIYARPDNVTGSGTTGATLVDYIDIHEAEFAQLHVIDYNFDGRQDLLSYNPKFKQWAFYLATPSFGGNWTLVKTAINFPFSGRAVSFGDVNADGLTDAVSITGSNELSVYLMERDASASISSSTAYRFSAIPLIYSLVNTNAGGFILDRDKLVRLSDFNGDGQADFMTWRNESTCTGRACGMDFGKFDVYLKDGNSYKLMASFSSSTSLFKSVQATDINSDGLMDLAVLRTDVWEYALNNGQGFDAFKPVHNSSRYGSYGLKDKGAAFADVNRDGFTDVIWAEKVNSTVKSIKVKYWLPAENGFSANFTYSSHEAGGDTFYSYTDVDGDGWMDIVGFSVDVNDYTRLSVRGLSSAKTDLVEEIDNGIGRKTRITYESLSQSKHYAKLAGVGNGTGNTYCEGDTTIPYTGEFIGQICFDRDIYATTAAEFYQQINKPFDGTQNIIDYAEAPPVQELVGPIYVVTAAKASAPTAANANNMNGAAYYYQSARIQGGGRGMLGFEKTRQVDLQTRITTVTTYRQDWPYIGQPVNSVTYKGAVVELTPLITPESAGVLGQSTSTPMIKNYNANMSTLVQQQGTAGLKGVQVFVQSNSQSSYSYNTDGNISPLTITNTQTDIDLWGNVLSIDTSTYSGVVGTLLSRTTTTNTYGNGSGDYKDRLGRLTRTSVQTRDGNGNSNTRLSAFEYCAPNNQVCPEGLLWKEIIEPDDSVYKLTTTYTYDRFGNKVSAIQSDANGAVRYSSTSGYDLSGRFVDKSVNIMGQESATVITRNRFGSATELKDINGVNINVVHDSLGREYLRTDLTGAWAYSSKAFCSQVGNCPAGAVYVNVKMVSGGGRSFEYENMLGQVIRTSTIGFDGLFVNVDTEYDLLGKVARQSNPYIAGSAPNGWTANQYDRMQRLKTTTLPDNTTGVTMAYQGTLTTTTNASGKQKIVQHNPLGQLSYVWDGAVGDTSQAISYQYDLYGKLTKTVSPGNVAVTICYDKLGRKFAMHDPNKGGFKGNANAACPADGKVPSSRLAGWWYYEHNSFGELVKQYDPKQQVVTMTYDSLRRMVTRQEAEGGTRWYYDNSTSITDSIGKLMYVISSPAGIPGTNPATACSGANHCTQYTYDNLGRQTHATLYLPNDSRAYITSVDYDTIGRVYRESDVMGVGSGVRHHFNAFGYEFQTTDLASGDVLHKVVSKNARSQVTEEWRFNGGAGITTYEYDPLLGNLLRKKSGLGNIFGIQNIEYAWDAVGNLRYRNNIKQNKQESFCYDALNRLLKTHSNTISGACSPTMSNADMEYSAGGNITKKNGVVYTYAGGTLAGPHAVTSTSDGISYQYDANGNLLSDSSGRSITYSSYDQPLRIQKGSNAIEFSYNADRSRWQRIDIQGSTRTTTTYLGNVERIQQQGATTIEWKRYIAGAIYTFKTDLNHVVQGNIAKRFTFTDHLGSLDTITDTVGVVTDQLSFDPWGLRRNGASWSALTASELSNFKLNLAGFTQALTRRGYTGHEMLDSMGLIHMNGRIYDPKLARFLQADPYIQAATNTQSYNRYSYTLNNPLNATDPSGYIWNYIAVALITYAVGDYAARHNIPWLAQVASLVGCMYGYCATAAFGSTYGSTKNLGLAIFSGMTAGATSGLDTVAAFFVGGMIGGMSSVMAGGDFWTGYLSGGLGSAAGAQWGMSAEGMIASMVIGGTVSEATGGKFINGAGSAAFSYAIQWAAHQYSSSGEDVEVLGAGGKEGKANENEAREPIQKLDRVRHMISEDENGNMTIKGTVGYGEGQKRMAEKYIEKVNGSYTTTSGSGESITLTVNLTLAAEGGVGDFTVLSLNQFSAATGKTKSYLAGNEGTKGPCVIACAAPTKGLLYFERAKAITTLHETFHLFGFGHQTWGVMKESEYTSLVHQDLKDLRSAYFGN